MSNSQYTAIGLRKPRPVPQGIRQTRWPDKRQLRKSGKKGTSNG